MMITLAMYDDKESSNGKINITDVLGIGKILESFASSIGKLLEKIPSEKITPGMTFYLIAILIAGSFILLLTQINSPMLEGLNLVRIINGILISLVVIPPIFLGVEIYKKFKK